MDEVPPGDRPGPATGRPDYGGQVDDPGHRSPGSGRALSDRGALAGVVPLATMAALNLRELAAAALVVAVVVVLWHVASRPRPWPRRAVAKSGEQESGFEFGPPLPSAARDGRSSASDLGANARTSKVGREGQPDWLADLFGAGPSIPAGPPGGSATGPPSRRRKPTEPTGVGSVDGNTGHGFVDELADAVSTSRVAIATGREQIGRAVDGSRVNEVDATVSSDEERVDLSRRFRQDGSGYAIAVRRSVDDLRADQRRIEAALADVDGEPDRR